MSVITFISTIWKKKIKINNFKIRILSHLDNQNFILPHIVKHYNKAI